MKYLALLFALFVTAAQAETILMICAYRSDTVLFRYSDGFLGLGTPTYEQRKDGDWVPFCEPYEESNARAICRPGEKGMFANYQDSMPNGEWKTYQTQTIDFELPTYVVYSPATVGKVTFFCERQK